MFVFIVIDKESAEWEKLDVRVKNRKSADLEEFRMGINELSSLYNSVWLKNVIKKCCGDLFDVYLHFSF